MLLNSEVLLHFIGKALRFSAASLGDNPLQKEKPFYIVCIECVMSNQHL